MLHEMRCMVAIASGSRIQVGIWAKALHAAAIGFLMVNSLCAPGVTEPGSSELGVRITTRTKPALRSDVLNGLD
jgi:hypothetical protein